MVIVHTRTTEGTCTIINIYNDHTLKELERFLANNIGRLHLEECNHMIWLGDFNCHHLLWDKECNNHLFTNVALESVQKVLTLLADYSMSQALPKTSQHYNCPAQVTGCDQTTCFSWNISWTY